MEYYVSYHKIIEFFKQIQQNSPRLKTMGHGDIVYFSENITGDTTAVYPYMFVTPELITYQESTTNYQFNVIFADIVNTDLSNEIDVISDMSIECKNFIASIYRGFLFDKIDIQLGEVAVPFMERFNDHVGGVYCTMTIVVFDDINACVEYPPPSATPTNTPTPSITPTNTPTISLTPTNTQTPTPSTTTTLTPTPTNTQTPTPTTTVTCPVTTQYLEVDLQSCHNFKLILWDTPLFTGAATALCDYIISGTAYGDMGTVYTGTEAILTGQHQHNFSLQPVLQPGECVSSFIVHSYTLSGCACPVNLVLPIPPTPTPTPTLTPTNTPTTTTTLTPTPSQTPTNTPTQTQTPTNTPTQTQTPTNTPSPTPLPLIVAGGLQFFSSANQNVKLSTDGGITWTNSSNSNSVFNLTHLAQAIGYNGSRWLAGSVIGAGQPTIAYSNNGSSWTASTNPNTIFSEVRGFAYGNSRWYAGGVATSGSSIATSNDGITWTGNTNITTGVFDINYNGSMFVVATTSLFYYSYDGLTYFSGNNYSNMTAPRKIAYDGSRYVGVGQGTNKIAYSDNGIDWYDSNNGNTISSGLTTVEGITWYGGMWIAGGFQQFSPGGNVIMYSYDGLNWSGGTNANSLIGRIRDIAWVGNKFVAVGGASNVVLNAITIIYSTNGITWTAAANSIYNQTGGYAVVPAIYPPLS